jgi:hypothetical protein
MIHDWNNCSEASHPATAVRTGDDDGLVCEPGGARASVGEFSDADVISVLTAKSHSVREISALRKVPAQSGKEPRNGNFGCLFL